MKALTKHIAIAIPAAIALSATAQDLKTEITVDRTIVPVERQASRPASLYPTLLQSAPVVRDLTLTDYSEPVALTLSFNRLPASAWGDTLAVTPYRGYASLGYFPILNAGASAGYRFIDRKRTSLDAWLQYDGTDYKPSDKDLSGSYGLQAVSAGVRFGQKVGGHSTLSAEASYGFTAIKLPDSHLNNRQNANMADIRLAWVSKPGLFGYSTALKVSTFAYGKALRLAMPEELPVLKATSDTRFTFDGTIGYYGSSEAPRGGIDLRADFLNRSDGVERTPRKFDNEGASTLGVITVTPYYALKSDRFSGRIGARVDLSVGGDGKKLHIAPDVLLSYNLSSGVAVYARAHGGERLNTLRQLYDYCPWIGGGLRYGRSNLPITADLGFNFGAFKGFSASIYGGYAAVNDWLMPELMSVPNLDGTLHMNALGYGSCDLRAFHAGAMMAYDWRGIVRASVKGETANNSRGRSYYLWRDRARYVLDAAIAVRPIKPLDIAVAYSLRADRSNYVFANATHTRVSLGNRSDLSLSAAYSFGRISVFARAENLLDRRDFIAVDIESQGIHGLLGASLLF